MIKIMKVSIIVPVYNVEPYIEDCLKSVGMQQYDGEIECIVVDDCGTDKSIDIARRYVKDYNGNVRFKIVAHEYNRGLSAARNTGIENSSGDYVYFLDSDDEMLPGAVQCLAEPVKSKEYDFVIGDYIVTGKYTSLETVELREGEHGDVLKNRISGKWYQMAVNKLVNRTFIIDNNIFFKEGLIHEDELWSFEMAICARNMYVVHKDTYHYRRREGSITTSGNAERSLRACSLIYVGMIEAVSNRLDLRTRIVNDFIQGRLNMWFSRFRGKVAEPIMRSIYIDMRQQMNLSNDYLIRCNKLKPRRNIRDAHLFLCPKIGWILFKWWDNGKCLHFN